MLEALYHMSGITMFIFHLEHHSNLMSNVYENISVEQLYDLLHSPICKESLGLKQEYVWPLILHTKMYNILVV